MKKQRIAVGLGTGNNLDYNSATWQNHRTPSSLKDTNKGLTPELFFSRKQTPIQIKTADSKNVNCRLVETRRLMMLENFTLMPTNPRIVQELITPCSLKTIKILTTHSRVGHTVLKALTPSGPLCLAKQ